MDWEISILQAVHEWRNPFLDAVFHLSNRVGRGEWIAVFIVIGIWRHWSNREKAWAVFWPVAGITNLLIIKGLKAAISRQRPNLWGEWDIHVDPGSMPSGHAVAATFFLLILAFYWTARAPRLKALIWTIAILGMTWVDLGRLYFGVHWPTDVMAGAALGAIFALIARFTVLNRPVFGLNRAGIVKTNEPVSTAGEADTQVDG